MKSSLGFSFNGMHSDSFDVYNIEESRALYEEQITTPFATNSHHLHTNGRIVATKKEIQPLEIPMSLYYKTKEKNDFRRIVNWLVTDTFEDLVFDDFPEKMIKAKVIKFDKTKHNGLGEGIISITFLAEEPYFLSLPKATEVLTVTEKLELNLFNDGDIDTFPTIKIQKKGNGIVRIDNITNKSNFELKNLLDTEKIFVDGERRIIHSSQETLGVYRGKDHNRNWLSLESTFEKEANKIIITGDCEIQFEYYYRYYSIF